PVSRDTRSACALGPRAGDPLPGPPQPAPRVLLLRDRHGQLAAPLAPAPTNDLSPRAGLHALAKTMRALATLAMGLKRSLHDCLRRLREKGDSDITPPPRCQTSAPRARRDRLSPSEERALESNVYAISDGVLPTGDMTIALAPM